MYVCMYVQAQVAPANIQVRLHIVLPFLSYYFTSYYD